MGAKAEPWQTAEIAGPKKALLILKPEVVVAMIKRANRPILIVGHHALDDLSEDAKMIDCAIGLGKTGGVPVVTTAHIIGEFIERGFQPTAWMSAMDIVNRLSDPEWKGLDGNGPYDLAMFMGLPYYMEFVLLAGLKHFSTDLKTISLDRYYNPHATWSFPNLSVTNWNESFETIINKLGGK
jgi:acetyl-CoA decarbonylase/synthase complex subunit epsilon